MSFEILVKTNQALDKQGVEKLHLFFKEFLKFDNLGFPVVDSVGMDNVLVFVDNGYYL